MDTDSVETALSDSSDKQMKKKRISNQQKEGETEKSTSEDLVQLPENCFSALPDAYRNGSSSKRKKKRDKKKEDDAQKIINEDQLHPPNSSEMPGAAQLSTGSNISKQQCSPPDATTNMTCPQSKKKRDTNALNQSGADIHGTDAEGSKSMSVEAKTVANVVINSCPNSKDDTVDKQEGADVVLNEMVSHTQSPKAKKRKRRRTKTMDVCDPLGNSTKSGPIECLEKDDENGGRELMSSLACQRDNSESGEKSGFQNLEKPVEKQKDEKTEVNENVLREGVCDVRSKKRKGKKKKKTVSVDPKTADMEVCDPSGNTLGTSTKSGPVECMDSNDGNAGREVVGNLATQRENSAAGEKSGFQNLEKTEENQKDGNTEVNEDILGAGVCGARSKKRKGEKKKTSSIDHKAPDMEACDPSGNTLLATIESGSVEFMENNDGNVRSKKQKGKKKKKTSYVDNQTADMVVCDSSGNTLLAAIESGSVEGLFHRPNSENVENCDGNAGEDFVGRATTSRTEKSATRERSGVQNSRKRKIKTEDENVESNQDALGEGVSDVGRKRQKRKRNKKKNCESVANMDHSNKKDVENYDGNADGEIVSKDPSRKIEDSATEEKSVQNVETTKNKNKDEKGEIDEDTLGAEGVSKAEVEAKKRKKNSVDYKPDNMEEKKDDVSIPRNDEEPEIDREKFETSLSSSVLIHDNVAQGVASLETELSSSVLIHDNVAQGVASLETEPSSSVLIHDNVAQAVASLVTEPRCSCEGQSSKKLVVFDFNGILADVVRGSTPQFVPDGKVSLRSVFRRPFVADFLNFCFERFVVGIWSSRVIGLDYMTNLVLGNHARNLLFCFDQNICTTTTFKTLENNAKPLFLKNLSRVWDRFGTCFTCGKRKYDETNTLLIDDSPDKALCNPPHTGIYPCPYQYTDVEDSALGPEGELRKYLERLAEAENVQKFVEENPIGQTAITETHKSWDFYSKVIERHN